jgi:predicted phage terminase large subunit-like protein
MIRTIPSRPLGGRAVRAWDIAASSQIGGNDPDWTVGVLGVQDVGDRFALCDVVRFRGGADEVRNTILATAALDGKGVEISIPQDPGAAGKNWAADIVKALRGFSVTVSPESGDKATRASPLASQVNVGNVDIVTDVSLIVGVANPKGPWNSVLLSELSGFPAATKDDQVDAAARAFNHINERGRPMRTGRLSGQLGRI